MAALAYTTDIADVIDITPAVAPAAPKARKVQQRQDSGDPLIDAATRLLSVPVRHAYALLFRSGLLVVNN